MTPWPKPLIVAAWIGSILSGVLALFRLLTARHMDEWFTLMGVGWLVLACLLLFPPLWMKRSPTLVYVRLAAGVALLIGALFMSI